MTTPKATADRAGIIAKKSHFKKFTGEYYRALADGSKGVDSETFADALSHAASLADFAASASLPPAEGEVAEMVEALGNCHAESFACERVGHETIQRTRSLLLRLDRQAREAEADKGDMGLQIADLTRKLILSEVKNNRATCIWCRTEMEKNPEDMLSHAENCKDHPIFRLAAAEARVRELEGALHLRGEALVEAVKCAVATPSASAKPDKCPACKWNGDGIIAGHSPGCPCLNAPASAAGKGTKK